MPKTSMIMKLGRTAAITATLAFSITSPAAAQSGNRSAELERPVDSAMLTQFLEDIGASERMNYSGKLRMLSQRIPAAACNLEQEIDVESSRALLGSATTEFDLIVDALEKGDDSLGIIGPETDRKVLAGLAKMHEIWDPLHSDVDAILAGSHDEDIVAHLATYTDEVLNIAKRLTSEIVNEYSDPTAVLQTDALTIDIAGRQRMLAQQISKDVCLLASGIGGQEAMDELVKDIGLYEASVMALRNGMPEAGISATENPVIINGLDEIIGLWNGMQPILSSVVAGEDISDENRVEVFQTMNMLTGKMNVLVGIYNEDSKLNL